MQAGATLPTSITTLQMLDGGNPAALVDADGSVEVFQYRDVATVDAQTVTLSYLLRGRRGSEEMTGNHAVGSRFVMLTAPTVEVTDLSLANLNRSMEWKAVGSADTLASVAPVPFTDTGKSLWPRAPWNVTAAIDSSSDILIGFDRRTRVGGEEWTDGDTEIVMLAEDTEAYSVDIYGGSPLGVIRTIPWTGPPPVTYPNAEVIADFGAIPVTLTLEVYQISGEVGRGFGRQFTVDVTVGPQFAPSPPLPLEIVTTSSPPTLPDVSVGAPYNVALQATGGKPGYVWTVTGGALPTGLTLASYGEVYGTPTSAGTTSSTITVTDANGNTDSDTFSLTVTANPTIDTTSLPPADVSLAYSFTLVAVGGSGTYTTWALTVGSLPAGLNLNTSTGVISGTPTTAGTAFVTFTVTYSASNTSAPAVLQLLVNPVPVLTSHRPTNFLIGQGSANFISEDVTGAIVYYGTAAGGPYPNSIVVPGATISVDEGTGIITVPIPSAVQSDVGTTYYAVCVVSNASGASTLSNEASIPSSSDLPEAKHSLAYSAALDATGGTTPYTAWALSSGSLPTGVSLDTSTGIVSGTPTATGSFTPHFTVTDALGLTSAAAALSLTVLA